MSSNESSDNEMPHDSSDEEVWEEEEMSSDEDSDWTWIFSSNSKGTRLHSSLSEIRHFFILSA